MLSSRTGGGEEGRRNGQQTSNDKSIAPLPTAQAVSADSSIVDLITNVFAMLGVAITVGASLIWAGHDALKSRLIGHQIQVRPEVSESCTSHAWRDLIRAWCHLPVFL